MLAAPPSTRSSAPSLSGKKSISPTVPSGPTASCLRHRRMRPQLPAYPSQPRELQNPHPNTPMPKTPRRANSRQAPAFCFMGLCRGAFQSWSPTREGRDRLLLLFFVFSCCIGAFATRAARAQDQPGPVQSPPPPQQTDRPPWARKNKNNSSGSSNSSTGSTDSSKNSTPTASTNPPPIVQPIPADDPPAAEQQRGRIKVNVQLVSVLASVLDEHNRPAIDISREKFHVFEEGVEQKLEVFESETQQPLDLVLMIDASLSAHKEIGFEQEASARFIRQILRPDDRLAVYSVGEDVVALAEFTDNIARLESAVHKM